MNITPTPQPAPKYPVLAAVAVAAALATPACMLQQQQQMQVTGGVAPIEDMPLVIKYYDAEGKVREHHTTHGEWERHPLRPEELPHAAKPEGSKKP